MKLQYTTFLNKKFFLEKYFAWYFFDALLLGFLLGFVGNIVNSNSFKDNLSFYVFGILIRLMVTGYQYARYKKNIIKILPLSFSILIVVLIINFINFYLYSVTEIFKILFIFFLSHIVIFISFLILKRFDYTKFLISYFLRFSIFFSGIFFDPVLIFNEYFFVNIFYLNPTYLFYLIMNTI